MRIVLLVNNDELNANSLEFVSVSTGSLLILNKPELS